MAGPASEYQYRRARPILLFELGSALPAPILQHVRPCRDGADNHAPDQEASAEQTAAVQARPQEETRQAHRDQRAADGVDKQYPQNAEPGTLVHILDGTP